MYGYVVLWGKVGEYVGEWGLPMVEKYVERWWKTSLLWITLLINCGKV